MVVPFPCRISGPEALNSRCETVLCQVRDEASGNSLPHGGSLPSSECAKRTKKDPFYLQVRSWPRLVIVGPDDEVKCATPLQQSLFLGVGFRGAPDLEGFGATC